MLLVAGIMAVSLIVGARLGKLGATPERRRDVLVGYAVMFVFLGVFAIPMSQGWQPDGLQTVVLTGVLVLVMRGILELVHLYF